MCAFGDQGAEGLSRCLVCLCTGTSIKTQKDREPRKPHLGRILEGDEPREDTIPSLSLALWTALPGVHTGILYNTLLSYGNLDLLPITNQMHKHKNLGLATAPKRAVLGHQSAARGK